MKKIFMLLICLILLCGCATEGIKNESTNNSKMDCTTLFEYDGVRIYRFSDCGEPHYFAKVLRNGDVLTSDDYTTNSGKTTTYHPNSIQTVR